MFNATNTFVEFARERGTRFGKRCRASKVTTLDNLSELIFFEEFKNRITEKM